MDLERKIELEKYAIEKYGINYTQFQMMCDGASDKFDGKGMNSVDHELACQSFYEGFIHAIKCNACLTLSIYKSISIGESNEN